MGIFDTVSGMFGGNQSQQPESGNRLLQAALSLLADNGQNGGLHGLVERFQEAGLGNVMSSWIGTGENAPITPQQIQQALGEGHLQQISEETGLTQDEAAGQLSNLLPKLVDTVTPGGHEPQGGLGNIGGLLERFIRIP